MGGAPVAGGGWWCWWGSLGERKAHGGDSCTWEAVMVMPSHGVECGADHEELKVLWKSQSECHRLKWCFRDDFQESTHGGEVMEMDAVYYGSERGLSWSLVGMLQEADTSYFVFNQQNPCYKSWFQLQQ